MALELFLQSALNSIFIFNLKILDELNTVSNDCKQVVDANTDCHQTLKDKILEAQQLSISESALKKYWKEYDMLKVKTLF